MLAVGGPGYIPSQISINNPISQTAHPL